MEASLAANPSPLPCRTIDNVEITEVASGGIADEVSDCEESRVLMLFQLFGSKQKLDISLNQCQRICFFNCLAPGYAISSAYAKCLDNGCFAKKLVECNSPIINHFWVLKR